MVLTAEQKPNKKKLTNHSQFFFNISKTKNARRLRVLPIDLEKHFAQKPYNF
jgi:hypothetical protein